MVIKELFKMILETESAVPVNNIAVDANPGKGIETYDKLLKMRKKYSPLSRIQNMAKSGPILVPSDNPLRNSLDNGNKHPDPLENLKKHDPLRNALINQVKRTRKPTQTKGLVRENVKGSGK